MVSVAMEAVEFAALKMFEGYILANVAGLLSGAIPGLSGLGGFGNTAGLNSAAMVQGGVGLVMSVLMVMSQPMAAMFFSGTLSQFAPHSSFGTVDRNSSGAMSYFNINYDSKGGTDSNENTSKGSWQMNKLCTSMRYCGPTAFRAPGKILRIVAYLFAGGLSAASVSASAQQPGTPAYNNVFLPGHGAGDTRQSGRDNWGSIAYSRNLPAVPVTGMRSKRQAERRALELCQERGGENCKIHHSFANICIAVAENESSIGSRADHPRESSAAYRRERALRSCDGDCKITWEGCAMD